MKVKEYIRKFNLDKSGNFNNGLFVEELSKDFTKMLDSYKDKNDNVSYNQYRGAVLDIRKKFDSISNKSIIELSEKLWGFFYATVIVKHKPPQLEGVENMA